MKQRRTEKFDHGDDLYEKETFCLKPSGGFVLKGKNFSNILGLGFIFEYGEMSADYYDIYEKKRMSDDGTTFGIGTFVQNKASYNITDSFSIALSLYAELSVSLSDPEIEGEMDTLDWSYFDLGIRGGVQYCF